MMISRYWQEERVRLLEVEIDRLKEGHRRLSDSIDKMRAELRENTSITRDMHEIMQNLRGFGMIVVWMGKTLMIIGRYVILPLILVAAGIYALSHGGKMPTWWTDFLGFIMR